MITDSKKSCEIRDTLLGKKERKKKEQPSLGARESHCQQHQFTAICTRAGTAVVPLFVNIHNEQACLSACRISSARQELHEVFGR